MAQNFIPNDSGLNIFASMQDLDQVKQFLDFYDVKISICFLLYLQQKFFENLNLRVEKSGSVTVTPILLLIKLREIFLCFCIPSLMRLPSVSSCSFILLLTRFEEKTK